MVMEDITKLLKLQFEEENTNLSFFYNMILKQAMSFGDVEAKLPNYRFTYFT